MSKLFIDLPCTCFGICLTVACNAVCVFQGGGEIVLHREQPPKGADTFPEWPDSLAQCK